MTIINYISAATIPIIIMLIIAYGLLEKNNVFDDFLDGVKEGIKLVYDLTPTLMGLFVAIGVLRSSGILDLISKYILPISNLIHFPRELVPLALIRPISGSASMAVATDIMSRYGVDSKVGLIASTIMGSTETTLYTIAVYTSCVKIKKIRFVLFAAFIADAIGMLISSIILGFLS